MGFEHPGAFVWLVGAGVLVALYVWRSAGRTAPVATFHLWQRALARRSLLSRLRAAMSLTILLLAWLLLVAALAGPYSIERAARRRSLVLVLDTSASMKTADGSPSRFDALRDQAALLIDDLQPEDRLAILAAGSPVRILTRLGESPGDQHAAWGELEPPSGPPRVIEAVRMARAMLQDQPNPEIVVLTDGAFEEAAELATAPDVRLVLLGGQPHRAAITRLAARPWLSEPGEYAVLVEVTNQGAQPIRGQVEIGLEGAVTATIPVQLAAGEQLARLATVATEEPTRLEAFLRYEGSPDDDRVTLPLDGWRPLPVRLIAEPSEVRSEIQDVLQSVPGVVVETDSAFPDAWDEAAVHVFHRVAPARLPAGGVLVLDPRNDSDGWRVADPHRSPLQAQSAGNGDLSPAGEPSGARHPLAGVRVAETVFERAAALEYAEPVQLLATFQTGEPLCTRLERPGGPVLVWHAALEPESSDFLKRDDFRRLLHNALPHLGDWPPTGSAVRAEFPRLLPPDGVVGQALPLVDAPRQRPLWHWLAAAAVLLLAVEGGLFHRNVTV